MRGAPTAARQNDDRPCAEVATYFTALSLLDRGGALVRASAPRRPAEPPLRRAGGAGAGAGASPRAAHADRAAAQAAAHTTTRGFVLDACADELRLGHRRAAFTRPETSGSWRSTCSRPSGTGRTARRSSSMASMTPPPLCSRRRGWRACSTLDHEAIQHRATVLERLLVALPTSQGLFDKMDIAVFLTTATR